MASGRPQHLADRRTKSLSALRHHTLLTHHLLLTLGLSYADPASILAKQWPEERATVFLPSCSNLLLHPSFNISVSLFLPHLAP